MIFKNQKKIFLKEIIKILKKIKKKKIFIDFTYGLGNISKTIIKNVSKESTIISYDFSNNINNVLVKKNFFFYNLCYTNFSRLKFPYGVDFSILDIGYTDNELLNNCFNNKKKIEDFVNFYPINSIKKILGNNFYSFNKYRKKVLKERGFFCLDDFLYEYRNKNKKKILFSFRNFSDSFKKKISFLLNYLFFALKKNSYLLVICFNSYESEIIRKFYNKNKFFFIYKKIVKKFNKNSLAVLRIFIRK